MNDLSNLPEIIDTFKRDIGEHLFKGGLINGDRKIAAQENVCLELIEAKKQIELKQIDCNTSITLSKIDAEKADIMLQSMKEKNIQSIIKLKQETLSTINKLIERNLNTFQLDNIINMLLSASNISLYNDDDAII